MDMVLTVANHLTGMTNSALSTCHGMRRLSRRGMIQFFLLLVSLLTLGPLYAQGDGADCIPRSQWYLPAKQSTEPASVVLDSFAKHRVILLGEHHDNVQHHRWQLQVIKDLYAIRKDLALGFEMFPRRLQPVLNQWVEELITEEEFLGLINWDSLWSFDIGYYLPIFRFAQKNHIPMYALNVDRELIELVRSRGWDAVPEQEREGLSDPAPPSREYLQKLAASFLRHNPADLEGDQDRSGQQQGEKFFRFVQGQLLWDRAMAEGIAPNVRNKDSRLFVALMGSWHIVDRQGVPHQLEDLGVYDTVVLVPWDVHFDCAQVNPKFADAIFGVPEQ
jgi:uncharacterized iron-regulated protein